MNAEELAQALDIDLERVEAAIARLEEQGLIEVVEQQEESDRNV